MTKLSNKKRIKNVRSHITDAYQFINQNLPNYYVDKTLKKLEGNSLKMPSSSLIRNVRNGKGSSYENRFDILSALVDVARDNLEQSKMVLSKIK